MLNFPKAQTSSPNDETTEQNNTNSVVNNVEDLKEYNFENDLQVSQMISCDIVAKYC